MPPDSKLVAGISPVVAYVVGQAIAAVAIVVILRFAPPSPEAADAGPIQVAGPFCAGGLLEALLLRCTLALLTWRSSEPLRFRSPHVSLLCGAATGLLAYLAMYLPSLVGNALALACLLVLPVLTALVVVERRPFHSR